MRFQIFTLTLCNYDPGDSYLGLHTQRYSNVHVSVNSGTEVHLNEFITSVVDRTDTKVNWNTVAAKGKFRNEAHWYNPLIDHPMISIFVQIVHQASSK